MNNEAMKEILNELFSHLERLETQSEAILQFLKEKKRVTEKQLAPYLEQAGNSSNVKWRAARIRIEHLLSPEHPEKEVKLGKQPELHEETARAGSSERSEAAGEQPKESEEKRTKAVENPVPADAVQIRPGDGKENKPEEKSESERQNKEQAAQTKQDQNSESAHHPTEVTEPLARKEGAEPAAQLKSEEKKDDQEAA
ncbi:MAG: hypothetical protein JWN42_186 [Candidatus Angelobacter sp.]|nr:hypothetical protein [Candidatus Angelobacter sp.]